MTPSTVRLAAAKFLYPGHLLLWLALLAPCLAAGMPASAVEETHAAWLQKEEVYLNGKWVGVEPPDRHSLRRFGGGYLIVDASGRHPLDDHFVMFTPDGRQIEGIQRVPVSGESRLQR